MDEFKAIERERAARSGLRSVKTAVWLLVFLQVVQLVVNNWIVIATFTGVR